mgnify:CR=1 FL=1
MFFLYLLFFVAAAGLGIALHYLCSPDAPSPKKQIEEPARRDIDAPHPELPEALRAVSYVLPWHTMLLPYCPLCGSQHPTMEHIGLKSLEDNHSKQVQFIMVCKDRSHAIPFRYSHFFETCDDGSLWYTGSTAKNYQFRHSVLDDNFSKEQWAAFN